MKIEIEVKPIGEEFWWEVVIRVNESMTGVTNYATRLEQHFPSEKKGMEGAFSFIRSLTGSRGVNYVMREEAKEKCQSCKKGEKLP